MKYKIVILENVQNHYEVIIDRLHRSFQFEEYDFEIYPPVDNIGNFIKQCSDMVKNPEGIKNNLQNIFDNCILLILDNNLIWNEESEMGEEDADKYGFKFRKLLLNNKIDNMIVCWVTSTPLIELQMNPQIFTNSFDKIGDRYISKDTLITEENCFDPIWKYVKKHKIIQNG